MNPARPISTRRLFLRPIAAAAGAVALLLPQLSAAEVSPPGKAEGHPVKQQATESSFSAEEIEKRTAIYDADPKHLWNRLFTAFYVREVEYIEGNSGVRPKVLGPAVLDPPLGIHPRFLLEDAPFQKGNAILDEFIRQKGELLIRDPLKRAVLQRDLWAVFDLLQDEVGDHSRNFSDSPANRTPEQQQRAVILSRKLAHTLKALALSPKEINSLPNTYAAALKSEVFSNHVVDQSKADYLPGNVLDKNTPWIEIFPHQKSGFRHAQIVRGRSVFRVFIKPPEGEEKRRDFLKWLKEVKAGFEMRDRSDLRSGQRENSYQEANTRLKKVFEAVPLKTQFFLLREMMCLDEDLNLVPTHVVESVQVRVYLTPKPGHGKLNQLFEEFDLDRSLLFSDRQGGLKPTNADRPAHFGYTALGRLSVTENGQVQPLYTFPNNCLVCHGREGPPGIQSLSSSQVFRSDGPTSTELTISWKKEQPDFKRLGELWNRTPADEK